MIVRLYLGQHISLKAELVSALVLSDLEVKIENSSCFCKQDIEIDKSDIVIVHPEYTNKEGCWSRIRATVETNPRTQFYLMTQNAGERENTIGKHPNLIYLNELNSYDFFIDPIDYIRKNRLKL